MQNYPFIETAQHSLLVLCLNSRFQTTDCFPTILEHDFCLSRSDGQARFWAQEVDSFSTHLNIQTFYPKESGKGELKRKSHTQKTPNHTHTRKAIILWLWNFQLYSWYRNWPQPSWSLLSHMLRPQLHSNSMVIWYAASVMPSHSILPSTE